MTAAVELVDATDGAALVVVVAIVVGSIVVDVTGGVIDPGAEVGLAEQAANARPTAITAADVRSLCLVMRTA